MSPLERSRVVRVLKAVLTAALLSTPGVGVVSPAPSADPAAASAANAGPAAGSVEKLIEDYIALYARPTLDRWKKLFHPALVVADPRPDGTVRTRGLEEFFKTQKDRFDTGRAIGERLENVRIDRGTRMARVTADFIFSDDGKEARGKIGLHLVQTQDGWLITAIVFSYDDLR